MKFSTFALGALALVTKVLAEEGSFFDQAHPDEDLTKFLLDYFIEEYPEYTSQDVAHFLQGETITLTHTVTNNEELDITVVGLGGEFRDPTTGAVTVNLTANSVGPVVIPPGQAAVVGQKINLDITAGSYIINPQVFVAFNDQLKAIAARSQLAVLTEAPVSFFNPQFLFLELLFVSIVGGIGYYFYSTTLQGYFDGAAPTKKPLATSGKSSSYDPSWVPSHHQTLQKKSKSRKAY